jgi:hypothetical protein
MILTSTKSQFLASMILAMLSIVILANSCKTVKVHIAAHASVDTIEASIHRQFYEAFQQLVLQDGITVIPQNLNVKFDHVTTNAYSGGLTVFSIVQSNFSYQRQLDNSVADVLAPTKISSSSGLSAFDRTNNGPSNYCVFDPDTLANGDAESVKNLAQLIQQSAKTFANIPNLGTLNDHQITLDIKFTIQDNGNISVSPTWVFGPLAKFNVSYQRQSASSDEIAFQFDVVKDPGKPFMSNADYYDKRKQMVGDWKKALCTYFPRTEYTDSNRVDTLYTPPAVSQHGYSACVAYAIGYTCLSTLLKKDTKPYLKSEEYSPDFIFARMTDNKCSGLDLPTTLSWVVENGDITLADFPQRDTMACGKYIQPNDTVKKELEMAKKIKPAIKNKWIPLDPNNIDQIRACINNGEPVVAGFYISSSFVDMWNYGNSSYGGQNVWSTLTGPYYDAHAVCIVGYNNNNRLFKVQNSWGDKNASHGFFYVTYDLVQRGCFSQAYSFIPVPPDN